MKFLDRLFQSKKKNKKSATKRASAATTIPAEPTSVRSPTSDASSSSSLPLTKQQPQPQQHQPIVDDGYDSRIPFGIPLDIYTDNQVYVESLGEQDVSNNSRPSSFSSLPPPKSLKHRRKKRKGGRVVRRTHVITTHR